MRLSASVYSTFGVEFCPDTGRKHYQGFTYRKQACSMSAMKKFLGEKTVHLIASKGTPAENALYCAKGAQPKEEWEELKAKGAHYGLDADVWSVGVLPSQGVRSDILALRDAIRSKRSLSDMLDDNVNLESLAKYGRFAEKVHLASLKATTRDFRDLEVTVHVGETGCGKTRIPYDLGAYKWEPSNPEWWCDYDGEDILLIDEFYGQLKPSRLQAILDGYQVRLPIKGGHTFARWTKIYITTNVDPSEWYGETVPQAVKNSLARRLQKKIEFMPDGSMITTKYEKNAQGFFSLTL